MNLSPNVDTRRRGAIRKTGPAGCPQRILVAEDDEEAREFVVAGLVEDGHDVVGVEDGLQLGECLEIITRESLRAPDLLVLDVRMPGRSGIDLVEDLRIEGWTTPAVLMTAFASPDLHARAEAAGSAAVVEKPFTLDGLRTAAVRARARGTPSANRARDAENLRLLGRMTAGISHDLRNVLNGFSMGLGVLERSEARDASDTILKLRRSVSVGVEMLDRLCVFGGAHAQPMREAQLSELAHEACELSKLGVHSSKQTGIVLRERHDPSPPVMAHRGEVVSAVMNLVANAIDAMPCGGTVDVITGAARGGAWVRVSDEGPGISASLRRRIFYPFFTTKGRNGNGLGLSQVLACARGHKGLVNLDTHTATGAAFTLWLPGSLQKD